ncbi:multicopper oxidase family protein [Marinomonas mediterranea]|uniref:Multicopper oxidase type 3 n=2 Tax=Marinomonas mediterranea TaxID=119864 RepID=F2JUM9_MARM1|nr:multicopper oxidase domain-containing protein [Marinomonas mediterranea]AAF75831.2 polyphenol oxidase [Marinomonas mediterranea MMB-1]ADZ89362.1 multicopper oxidase type 3 [Marinomonas mediterranea MMB-1]WCN07463.1 multicopper oxidase domain-containing protein [Marinomonas mediterranea]WCN15627.1 multicopper oxidase domain-containing protein [Marinomonas mediterranea MMB-1]
MQTCKQWIMPIKGLTIGSLTLLLAACSNHQTDHASHDMMSMDSEWTPNYIKLADYSPPTAVPEGVGEGCEYKIIPPEFKNVATADVLESGNGELNFTMSVAYQQRDIAGCNTWLRNYAYAQGDDAPKAALVGPTLKLKPGDILRFRLENRMPDCDAAPNFLCSGLTHHNHADSSSTPLTDEEAAQMNTPHNFNVTNFHTHGLWVSPSKNSDNVLLELQPGYAFDYEIRIPEDHPQGTFWYHAHVHGSTALQVSSGMAGAIIIEGGDPAKDVGQQPQIKGKVDHTFVMQQVAYDCNGVIEYYDANDVPNNVDVCEIDGKPANIFGPGEWQKTERRTLVNGQVVPRITLKPGEIQRWRFIHAGVRESLKLVTVRNSSTINLLKGIIGESNAIGTLNQIAVDGLNTGQLDEWCSGQPQLNCDIEALQPGYRADYLYQAPTTPGTYWLIDDQASDAKSLQGVFEDKAALMQVVVEGELQTDALPTSSSLASYQAHPTPTATQIAEMDHDTDNTQDMMFYLGSRTSISSITDPMCLTTSDNDLNNGQPGSDLIFSINGLPFGQNPDRDLTLGQWQRWNLCTRGLAPMHPYHIHVNPFYAYRTGPDGEQQGVWRDTLAIEIGDKNAPSNTVAYSENRYPTTLPGIDDPLTVKQMYTGAFVLHCHILDHEDQGMMQKVVLKE